MSISNRNSHASSHDVNFASIVEKIKEHTQAEGNFPNFQESGCQDYNQYLKGCIELLKNGFFLGYQNSNAVIQLDFDLSKKIELSVFDDLIVALNSYNCPSVNSISDFIIRFLGYQDSKDKEKAYVEICFDDTTGKIVSNNSDMTYKIGNVFHAGFAGGRAPEGMTLILARYILSPETIETLGFALSSTSLANHFSVKISEEQQEMTPNFDYEKNWQADKRFYHRYDNLAEKINQIVSDHPYKLRVEITGATINPVSFHNKLSRHLSKSIEIKLNVEEEKIYFNSTAYLKAMLDEKNEQIKILKNTIKDKKQELLSHSQESMTEVEETSNNSHNTNYSTSKSLTTFLQSQSVSKRKASALGKNQRNNTVAGDKVTKQKSMR